MKTLTTYFVGFIVLFSSAAVAQGRGSGAGPEFSISSGSRPFAGDRRLLTTISPNGDGIRDRAAIHVRLAKRSAVTLVIAKTERRAKPIYRHTYRLSAGSHTLYWAPPSNTPPRTYLTLISVDGRAYGARSAAPRLRQETPAIRVLGVDAAFRRDSYRPGQRARLRVAADAETVTLQVFRVGPEHTITRGNAERCRACRSPSRAGMTGASGGTRRRRSASRSALGRAACTSPA